METRDGPNDAPQTTLREVKEDSDDSSDGDERATLLPPENHHGEKAELGAARGRGTGDAGQDEGSPPYSRQRKPNHIVPLDGVRGLASLHVFAYHFFVYFAGGAPELSLVGPLVRRGFVGVLFFFLLSGLVLAVRHTAGPGRPFRAFALRRAARLAPMYYASLLACVPYAFGAWGDMGLQWGQGGGSAPTTCVGSTILGVQAWLPRRSLMCLNPPLWSVSCEAFAYLCLGPLWAAASAVLRSVKTGSSRSGSRCIRMVLSVAALLVVQTCLYFASASTLLRLGIADTAARAASLPYGFPIVRVCEFACGVVLGVGIVEGWLERHADVGGVQSATSAQNLDTRSLPSAGVPRLQGEVCRVALPRTVDLLSVGLVALLGLDGVVQQQPVAASGSTRSVLQEVLFGELFGIWYLVLVAVATAWLWALTVAAVESASSSSSRRRSIIDRNGAQQVPWTVFLLSQSPLTWLGDVSYSTYVLQFPFLIYSAALSNGLSMAETYASLSGQSVGARGTPLPLVLLPPKAFVPLLAVLLAVSALARRFVEVPSIRRACRVASRWEAQYEHEQDLGRRALAGASLGGDGEQVSQHRAALNFELQ